MSCTVYNHPDGFTLALKDHTLTATDDDKKIVSLNVTRKTHPRQWGVFASATS